MTDLTEQWQKGKLPAGYYYVKNEFGNIFPTDYSEEYDCISDVVVKDFWTEVSEIKEVLEPVPSYEQWQKHHKTLLKTQEKNCDLEIINKQLKELLKECLEVLKMVAGETIDFPHTVDECIDKINQALGEDK